MQNEPGQLVFFFLLVTLLIASLSGFILAIMFKYQQKHSAYINNLDKIKTEHETLLLKSQLEIQEATLNKISKEIHDNIGLSLTLAKLNLTKEENLEIINPNIKVAVDLLTDAISNLRNLSRTLNSDYVLKNGFCKSLQKEINYIQKSCKTQVQFEIQGEPFFLEASKELIIFRIVQEALNNAVKHSNASLIETKLLYKGNQLELSIKDNGKGFKYGSNEESYSGLKNIIQRANILEGICDIQSQDNIGTTIQISIPNKDCQYET